MHDPRLPPSLHGKVFDGHGGNVATHAASVARDITSTQRGPLVTPNDERHDADSMLLEEEPFDARVRPVPSVLPKARKRVWNALFGAPNTKPVGEFDTTAAASTPKTPTDSSEFGLKPGATVGRYFVLERLGSGGMGVVYAAYDPKLDRKVAIKRVLPGRGNPGASTRLLREAQALAKLRHVNVVNVYDVAMIKELDLEFLLVMELVEGSPSSDWLQTPRHWHEVLEVMQQAGRGLAAAHEADLLHRDFKPGNVMIGDDGKVRVMDFGLVRMDSDDADTSQDPSSIDEGDARVALTRTGALLGTPAYMSPEQLGLRPLTAASDQFAFCVTLWEALYGERPFHGETLMELAANVLAGRLRPPPTGRSVPPWLRQACERGLAVDPAARWPSMQALLDHLGRGRRRARTRIATTTLGLIGGLGIVGYGYHHYDLAQRRAQCMSEGDTIATAWNSERARALRSAIVATGVNYAPTAADKVVPWLDRHAAEWAETRAEVCLDDRVRETVEASITERAGWCLDMRKMGIETVIEELLSIEPDAVPHAVSLAASLPAADDCRNEPALTIAPPPPAARREDIQAARREITRADILRRMGQNARGLEVAHVALEHAETRRWAPLLAEARLQRGLLLLQAHNNAEAERVLEDAYFDATNGVAPGVAFEAALGLARSLSYYDDEPDAVRRWERLAEAALEDIPEPQLLHRAELAHDLGMIDVSTAEFEDAQARLERALALEERALGSVHPTVTRTVVMLAMVYFNNRKLSEAKRMYERALVLCELTLGRGHPHALDAVEQLTTLHQVSSELDGTEPVGMLARATLDEALGPEDPQVGEILEYLAQLHSEIGAPTDAAAFSEEVRKVRERD